MGNNLNNLSQLCNSINVETETPNEFHHREESSQQQLVVDLPLSMNKSDATTKYEHDISPSNSVDNDDANDGVLETTTTHILHIKRMALDRTLRHHQIQTIICDPSVEGLDFSQVSMTSEDLQSILDGMLQRSRLFPQANGLYYLNIRSKFLKNSDCVVSFLVDMYRGALIDNRRVRPDIGNLVLVISCVEPVTDIKLLVEEKIHNRTFAQCLRICQ